MSEKANFRALLPMIVFLVLFIGTGIALTAAGADMPFYQLSATVAIIPAIVLAILQGKDDLNKKIGVFLSGVGDIPAKQLKYPVKGKNSLRNQIHTFHVCNGRYLRIHIIQ